MDSWGILQVLQFKSHTSYQPSISSISFVQHLITQRLRCNKSQAEQELSIRQHLQSQTQRENQTQQNGWGGEWEERAQGSKVRPPPLSNPPPSFTKVGGISCSSRIWVNTPVIQLICTKWAFSLALIYPEIIKSQQQFWLLNYILIPISPPSFPPLHFPILSIAQRVKADLQKLCFKRSPYSNVLCIKL